MDVDGGSRSIASPPANPSLPSIDTRRAGFRFEATDDNEPLSPVARLFQDIHTITVIGLAAPIDMGMFRAGLEATLVQHPRFCSIRVMKPIPRWVRTGVNLDDHVIVPGLDHTVALVHSDELLEDYLASLSTIPMDDSRPLWDVHVLDFPTSEAAATLAFRIHHAIGDGTSILSLLVACAESTGGLKPKILQPALPPAARQKHPSGTLPPRAAKPAGVLGSMAWLLSCGLFAWHSAVDFARFLGLPLLGDPYTLFTGIKGVEFRRKRFVSRSLSFADVKHVKNALNCTVNDVLLGVASAALSWYYFRKKGHRSSKKGSLCLRMDVLVDMRPIQLRLIPGIHTLENLMDPNTPNDAKWGNRIGYMILPFHIVSNEDPVEYVRRAKKTTDRQKDSLEAVFTQKISEMATQIFGVKVSGAVFHRMTSNTTLVSSNVVGPTEQIELFRNKVVYIAPSIYGHPQALTIHWISYVDTIRVVLAVDDEQFPDSHQLLDDFIKALKVIKDSL